MEEGKEEEAHASSPETVAEEKRFQSTHALRETDGSLAPAPVCFYTEVDLQQTAAPRKKPAPPDGVSFF